MITVTVTVQPDNGILTIEAGIEAQEDTLIEDVLAALYYNDMDFVCSTQDGWCYIVDANHGRVYLATDYGFDLFHELREYGSAVMQPHDSKEDYDGYEWNVAEAGA